MSTPHIINLIGAASITFSGLVVKNQDGSKHHTIGILPDVLVTPTLEDIKNRKDTILETALKLAENK